MAFRALCLPAKSLSAATRPHSTTPFLSPVSLRRLSYSCSSLRYQRPQATNRKLAPRRPVVNPRWITSSRRFSVLSTSSKRAMSTMANDAPVAGEGPLSRLVERLTDRLETPVLDDRSYRVIRLPNKLEALVVHDPETDKASAAMDVNVGNFSDRSDMPGMAHAVEHLLFMGTEKYPEENEYSQYLTTHSGSTNAYTSATSTNYYFEVSATAEGQQRSPFYGALDRFAQFFIAPLFLPSTLDRELQAVDSEHKKNLQNDRWRLYQLSKSTSNPQHPFHSFGTGSLETLRDGPRARGIDVREEFMRFHEQHYSANTMKLVVLGRESLDELESWVVELFSAVRNKDLPQYRWDSDPVLSDKELLTQCFAKPVMENRSLELSFPFLDEDNLFESQPSRYISQLIGHEGPGSILAYIKSRGWATELSAGLLPISPGSSIFEIGVRLTEEGMKHYQDVVITIFQYISLVREQPPLEWVVDELKSMSEIDFRFKQKTIASRFTSKISSVMQKPLPRAWLLSGFSLIRKFDAEAIRKGLDFLRPDNFRLTVVGPDFDDRMDQREQWYGTQYHLEKIPEDFRERIAKAGSSAAGDRLPELRLPNKNDFIPTRFDVEKQETKSPLKAPKLIRNDVAARTWWKKDDTFWVPKGHLQINIRNPLVLVTPENVIKTELFTELVHDALVEYAYDAELAGLSYMFVRSHLGMRIEIQGYNDKMSVLLEKILTTIRDFQVRPDRFDIIKERLLEDHQNWELSEPYQQVGEYSSWLDADGGWINEHFLGELGHIEASDVQAFHSLLLDKVHLEVLAHGNFHKEEALKFTSLAEKCLRARPLPLSQWPLRRSLILPPGSNFTYARTLKDPLNVNNCIHYVLSVGDSKDQPLRARLLLFAQMTEEPAFDQLRTKEQLGYVVFSGLRTTATLMGYRVLIQSEKPAAYLEERIDAFLRKFPASVADMSAETFEGHKRSLIMKRTEKPKNLSQETLRYSAHIGNEILDFDRVDKDVASLEPLTKDDILDFYDKYIRPDSPSRAKLSVYLHAQAEAAAQSGDEAMKTIALSIADFLTASNVPVETEKLQQRLAGVEVPSLSSLSSNSRPDAMEAVLKAVEQYLHVDLSLDAAKVSALLESGRQAMGLAGASTPSSDASAAAAAAANEDAQPKEDVTASGSTNPDATLASDHATSSGTRGGDDAVEAADSRAPPSPAVLIEDVRDFKARLAVTSGARPIKPLSEYGELSAKL